MNNIPCPRDCLERDATCHSRCRKYIEWSTQNTRRREDAYRQREMAGDASRSTAARCRRGAR
ncbi:MAG: hypothetical protein MJ074_07505 [Oscillospiraceae bacterium]|nr:hypothetical protein [Oscillospiraceae bacterium]